MDGMVGFLGRRMNQGPLVCLLSLGPLKPGDEGRFPTMTIPFTWTVPCEQCARLQQHAAARDKDLGWSGDSCHGHSSGCLHGHR